MALWSGKPTILPVLSLEQDVVCTMSTSNITAVVKWFNPTKGFGFVSPTDGSADAFLHQSVLRDAGLHGVTEGSTVVCDLAQGPKGMQVAVIHSVEERPPGAMPLGGMGGGMGMGMDRRGPAQVIVGTVKFFNTEKGFGFVTPDDGGRDVFVHVKALIKSGLQSLDSQQRVRMNVRQGQKGLMAEQVELI